MFDATLRYQFVVFVGLPLGASTDADNEAVKLGEAICAASEGDRHLQFRAPQLGQMLAVGVGGPENVTMLTWHGKTGVWKLIWAGGRLELQCDALAFAAIENSSLSIEAAARVVAPSLGAIARATTRYVTRAALVVTAEDMGDKSVRTAVSLAAPHLEHESNEITEFVVRVNRPSNWNLSGAPKPYLINRIETVTANHGPTAPPPTRNRFAWQLDWNTDPEQTHPHSEPMMIDFFSKAASELSRKLEGIGEGRR